MVVVKIKKQKTQKTVSERKVKSGNYKNCLEVTQPVNKVKYLEKLKLTQIFLKKS